MPSLLLLLTILTAPAVPQSLPSLADVRPTHLAEATPFVPLGAIECDLRMSAGGVPLVRVEVQAGYPAWFVLDTGATGTTIQSGLVRRLGLAVGGHVRLTTVDGTMSAPTVRLDEFRIAGVPVTHPVEAAVHALALVRQTAPEAEGILGQDILARYDYMVDQVRQRLIIGRFAPPPRGVRVPLLWSAGRPVLQMGAGPAGARLVLDTGANVLVMEATAARLALGDAPPAGRSRALLQTHAGARAVDVEHHVGLRMATVDLPPVAVVRLPADAWRMAPEVGLLPASLFARVYVSARTGEAAVWPR